MPARTRRGPLVRLRCPRCGAVVATRVRGGRTTCPACRGRFYVPVGAAGRPERTWAGAAEVTCPGCGHEFTSRARPGSGTRCRECGAKVAVPHDPGRWVRPRAARTPAARTPGNGVRGRGHAPRDQRTRRGVRADRARDRGQITDGHGTIGGYKAGCPCPRCRAANAAASRAKRQRARARKATIAAISAAATARARQAAARPVP